MGQVTTSFPGSLVTAFAVSVAIDSSHRIVVGGSVKVGNALEEDFALARYNWDGSADSSFGSNGQVRTSLGTGQYPYSWANSMAIDSSGRILLGRYFL